jgi:hypothetical protein
METMNVLGVSFSSRLLGLSVMRSHHLVDYSMKLYKDRWTPAKCDQIRQALATYVTDYDISDIVLSIPPHHYQTEGFEKIHECINELAESMKIPLWEYSYKKLPTVCIPKEKMDKNGFMRSLVYFYPELYKFYLKERRNKKKYYIKLFEAIGATLVHVRVLCQNQKKCKG